MSILLVKDLKKTYTMGKMPVPALRGVAFEVEEGELIAIFGPFGIPFSDFALQGKLQNWIL